MNPGLTVATARDITRQLTDALQVNETVILAHNVPGAEVYYAIDSDQINITAEMGARRIIGMGGRNSRTTVVVRGSGIGIRSEAIGTHLEGFYLIHEGARAGTGVYLTLNRYQTLKDVYAYRFDAGFHLHGPSTYYWTLEKCRVGNCNKGYLFTEDGGGFGPNRGLAQECLASACDIGYSIEGAGTMDFFACRSADNQTGLFMDGSNHKWIGGSFEGDTVNAIDIPATARDLHLRSFTIDVASTISNLGTRVTLEPCADRLWEQPQVPP